MARYTVSHDYRSAYAGPYVAGQEVDVDETVAEWVNRDSPGTLVPCTRTPAPTGEEGDSRAPSSPSSHRQVKRARKRDES